MIGDFGVGLLVGIMIGAGFCIMFMIIDIYLDK